MTSKLPSLRWLSATAISRVPILSSSRYLHISPPLDKRLYYSRRVTINPPLDPLIPASRDDRPKLDPLQSCKDDQPLDEVTNPYAEERQLCILCKYGIKPDYKNPRLLSQFISSFSGRLYGKHVTGLCEYRHRQVREAIRVARGAGYMPIIQKDPRYLGDPKLFDPMRPLRANPF